MASKSLLITAAGLMASVTASSIPSVFQKRWDTSICNNNPGAAVPDSDTFQLPLEGYRNDKCWDICLGDQSTCATTTQVCFDFLGANLVFNYSSVSGYTYTEADIWLGLTAPDSSAVSQYTTSNGACTISTDASTASCTIPYSSIITSGDVLSGMCPNGDAAGLTFYLNTNAALIDSNGNDVAAEAALSCADYPTCSETLPETYWELYYRCTDCPAASSSSSVSSSTSTSSSSSVSSSASPVLSSSSSSSSSSSVSSSSTTTRSTTSSAPCTSSSTTSRSSSAPSSSPSSSKPCTTSKPTSSSTPSSSTKPSSTPCKTSSAKPTASTTKYCNYGTAFGHHSSCSNTFQSLRNLPSSCNRWGWFETFTSSQIASGLSGQLYVGAGGNDLSKAVGVGSWTASTAKDGKIYVNCAVGNGYSLGSVSVDVGCSSINSCNPNNFDYNFSPAAGTTSLLTTGFAVPNCGRTGTPYIIVQASVNSVTTIPSSQSNGYTCPKPVCQ